MDDALYTVYGYHDRTKHHLRRYARSLGYLDWATQPEPFLRFAGCPVEELPIPEPRGPTWDALFGGGRTGARPPGGHAGRAGSSAPGAPGTGPASATPSGFPSAPVDRNSQARFLYLSMALSAWKQVTDEKGEVVSRWALRVNPSSGNLHPTEAYLGDRSGLWHYRPDLHGLERRADLSGMDDFLPDGAFLAGLTSIPWREAWKYGERAFRYCQHDAGHAIAAMALAARSLGWSLRVLPECSTARVEEFLGCATGSGPEREHGDAVLAVGPGSPATTGGLPRAGNITGEPGPLSPEHQDWPVIPEVAAATAWPGGGSNISGRPGLLPVADRGLPAFDLVRGRRSAVAMDGETGMPADAFLALLGRTLPAAGHPVFDAWPWAPEVSLAIFVHRVEGLAPGLYALVRDPAHRESLQASLRADFRWERPAGCPEDLPFFLLGAGDVRRAAGQLSCGQAIAADGAFSLGMLARFDHALETHGPGFYPWLFRETGLIGQMLYLESEAAGLRGTGIGCFFDDEVHGALGIRDHAWQSLYHFTVGGAVDDPRLTTEDPYLTRR